MNKILPIILVIVLSGCASKSYTLPSGKIAHKVECDNWRPDWCYQKASKICKGKPYTVEAEDEFFNIMIFTTIKTKLISCNE
tara:strand:+ start:292 stop:537 length:246 start_codon:yes stop_codon:yes gene_type:complete